MDTYETWVRGEIKLAQARLDEMRGALSVYIAWRASRSQHPLSGTGHSSRDGSVSADAPRKRASKNDVVLEAFKEAGSPGLSQEDVQRIAHENGMDSSANTLRAFCWNAKKKGLLISIAPGRYAIAPREETAAENLSEGEAAAVSTRSEHNQHREGVAGGGI